MAVQFCPRKGDVAETIYSAGAQSGNLFPNLVFLPMELAAVQIADQNESEISAME